VAEAGRIAETGWSELERDPWEHRELQIARERQLASGLALDETLDVVSKIIRIHENEDEQQRDHHKGDQRADGDADDLQCTHPTSSSRKGDGRLRRRDLVHTASVAGSRRLLADRQLPHRCAAGSSRVAAWHL